MHDLHNRYPEQKNKMSAVNQKLLKKVKVVATKADFLKHKLFGVLTDCSHGRNFVVKCGGGRLV